MSPIDAIINMLNSYSLEALAQANADDPNRDHYHYMRGKADGLKEAADHLRNLQKLFN